MDTAIRPKAALVFIGAAIFVAGGLAAATFGWYLRVATESGSADGAVMEIAFVGCPDAAPVIAARLADYGIPAEADGLRFRVTLPGRMVDEQTHMPGALAAPGLLEVRVNGTHQAIGVESVGVQLAFSGTPITLVMLATPLPEQGVTVEMDGQPVEVEEVTGQELQLAARAGQSDVAIRLATDRAVAIRHPLPCPVVVKGP